MSGFDIVALAPNLQLAVDRLPGSSSQAFNFAPGSGAANGYSSENITSPSTGALALGKISALTTNGALTRVQMTTSNWLVTRASCVDQNAAKSGNTAGTVYADVSPTGLITIPQSMLVAQAELLCTIRVDQVRISLTKTSPSDLQVGKSAAYSLNLTNNGILASGTSLVLYDQLPPNLQYSDITPAAGGTVTASNASCTSSGSAAVGQLLTCTVTLPAGGLPPGGSTNVNLNVIPLTAGLGTQVINRAAMDPGGGNRVQTPSDCTAKDKPYEGCAFAPALTMTQPKLTLNASNPAQITVGVPANYSLTLSNSGTAPSDPTVVVTDLLPANLSYNSAALVSGPATAISCTAAGQVQSCSLTIPGGLAPGGQVVFNISATPDPNSGGTSFKNTAYVDFTGLNAAPPTNYPASCTGTDTPIVGCAAAANMTPASGVSLRLAKVAPASLVAGQAALYQLVVTNNGTGPATPSFITVADQLPPNVQYTGVSVFTPTGGITLLPTTACSASGAVATGQLVSCNLYLPAGGLPNGGGTAGINLSVTPTLAATGSLVNKAALDPAGNNAPQTPANCTADDQPTVGCAVTSAQSVLASSLQLSITSSKAGSFTFSGDNGWVSQSIAVGTPDGTGAGASQALTNPVATTLTLASNPGGMVISNVSCSAMGSGAVSNTPSTFTLTAAAMTTGNAVSCLVRLVAPAQLGVTVSLPGPANATFALNPDATLGNGWPSTGFTFSSAGPSSQTSAVQTLSALNVATQLNQAAPSPASYSMGAVICSDANYAVSGNPSGSFAPSQPVAGSFQIGAAFIRSAARINCVVPYLLPATASSSSMSVAPAGPVVAGVSSYTVTSTSRDVNGDLVSAVPVTFNVASTGGSLSAGSCTTATSGANAGSCSVSLSSSLAGTFNVNASLSGQAIAGSPASAVFVAGTATAATSQVTISTGPKTANGIDAYTITASTYDANGNLASGSSNTFSFSAPAPGASLSASSCTTVAGTCSVTLTATAAGSYAITANLGGDVVGGINPVTAVFVAGAATAGASRVTISAGPKTANGVDAYTIAASALDGQGNLNTSQAQSFSFSAPGAGAALSASSCATVAGICTVTLTATVAGSYAITASLGGTAVGGSNPVVAIFEPGEPVAASSRVTISPGPKTANGVDAYTITASAIDSQGNLGNTTSTTFNFSAPTAGASLSASACVSAASGPTAGTCSVTLTATVAGSYAVTTSLGGTAVGGTNPVTGVFVAGTATAGASRVTISAGPKTANGVDAYTITASALDANGNLNTNSATLFSFSAPGAGAALSASSCNTVAGTCSVTLTATVAGSYAVSTSTGGVPVGGSNPVTGVFVAGAATAGASQVTISAGPKTANGVDAYTITASALDANGNLNASSASTFSFSAPGAGAALSASTCTTVAGTCSVSLTATAAGSYAITANLGGTVVGGTNPVTAVFVAGAATAGASRVTISAGPKTADGVDAYTITASALDTQGNLNGSSATTFSFSAPGVGAALSGSTCTTAISGGSAGTCTVRLTATVAGSYAVSATLGGMPVGGSNPVTGVFVAGTATAGASQVTISAGPKLADGVDAYTITASALDANGNPNPSGATTFSFSVQGAGAVLSATTCTAATSGASAGTCSVSLKATAAGSYAITASLAGTALGGTNPVTAVFVAGPPAAAASRLSLSAGPLPANGSSAFTLSVTALDANGNLSATTATTFSFSPPTAGANLSASSCTTGTSGPGVGTCSVSLTATVAGSYSITASLGGNAIGGTNPVTAVFVAGSPVAVASRLDIDPGPHVANGSDAYTLTLTAFDSQGNPSTGNATTFSLDLPVPGTGSALGAGSCTTATSGPQAGRCSVPLTATVAGQYSVRARLDGLPVGGNNPAQALFVAGSPVASGSRLDISAGPRLANGVDAYTLTVSARDVQGNLNTSTATAFTFSISGAGDLSGSSCTTAISGPEVGTCSVTLTSRVAGSLAVTASLGGTPVGGANPVTAVFVAAPPTPASARVSLSPGPLVADGVQAYALTVSALDADGNLNTVAGITVNFSDPAAGASLSASACTTATSGPDAGTCTVSLKASLAGSYAITARLGGALLGGTNPVMAVFVPGNVTAAGSRLAINPPGPVTADNLSAYTLTVRAQDGLGNLNATSAMTFSFSDPGAGASLSASQCTTPLSGAEAGICSVTLRATQATAYSISASLGGAALGGVNPVSALFVAGEAFASTAQASIDGGPRVADGQDNYTLTASATDAFGNVDSSRAYTFSFNVTGAGAALDASSCTTATSGAQAGRCTVGLRSVVAGLFPVSVSLGGQALGGTNPLMAAFVAGAVNGSTARVVMSTGPRIANGTDAYTLTAQALDAQGNLNTSAGVAFSFSAPGAGAVLSANTCTTATSGVSAGTCSVTLTATVAGSYALTASVGGNTLLNGNPLTALFVAGAASAASSSLAIDTGPKTADGLDAYTVTATVRDALGNPVTASASAITFSVSAPGAQLSAGTCTTATSGAQAGQCGVALSATVAGRYTVSARMGGEALLIGNPVQAEFVAGQATAASSRITLSPAGPKAANGADAYSITVSALDSYGNLVTGVAQTFSFTAPGHGALLGAGSCTTTTGLCSVEITATVAGAYSVGASLSGTPVDGGRQVNAVFQAGAVSAAVSKALISQGPKIADGVDAYTLTAMALDALGNTVTLNSSAFSFSVEGAPNAASLSAANCVTPVIGAEAGRCSVSLASIGIGLFTVNVRLDGVGLGNPIAHSPLNAEFVAGSATASASRVTLSPGPKTANGLDAYTIMASALDAQGNLNTAQAQSFSFSAPGTGASLSASTCTTATSGASAGTCSVGLTATVAGSYAITATTGGVPVGGTNPVTGVFVAGSATASASRVTISAGPKTANGVDAYTLTVSALDASGNLNASGVTTFGFSAPGAGAGMSASTCATVAGTCSVTLTATVAGSYAITTSLGGTAVGGANPVTGVFVAGSATAGASRVAISAGPKTANGVDAYTITASALDANGNLNANSATTFSFSAPGAGAALSASSCNTVAGTCSVTLTATVSGSYAVSATTGGVPVGGTNPVTAVFLAGMATAGASRVTISAGPKTANGVDGYTITASALDAQGNLNASSATLFSFSAPGAGAALSANICTTATSGGEVGACSVTLTATVAGSYAITADLAGAVLGGTNPVTGVFVAGTPTAGTSRVTISPGPKTANGVDGYTITASALDANGNLNASSATTFSFSAPGAGAALSASTCTTVAGTCSVTLTAMVAGSYAVSATTGGVPVGGTNPVTGVFVAGTPTAGASRVAISAGPKLANGVDSYTISVTGYDAQGNLSSFNGTTFSFSDPGVGASLSALQCATALSGADAGSCSVTLTATAAGSYALTADLAGAVLGGTNPVAAVFVAGTPTAGASRVTISPGPKTANGVDAYTITASALDAQGNLNTSSATTFSFSAPGAGAALSASSCNTVAGTCSVTLTATVAGSYAVSATTGGVPVGGSNPVTGVFVASGADAGQSRVSIALTGATRIANGADSYTITATAYDVHGNLNTWQAQVFAFSWREGGAVRSLSMRGFKQLWGAKSVNQWTTLSANTCTTAASGAQAGRCLVTLQSTRAGWFTVVPQLDGLPVGDPAGGPLAVQFVAGPPTAANSTMTVSLGIRQADGLDTHTVTITARDAFDNVQADVSALFTFSPPAAGASLIATSCSTTITGPDAGSCSVTLRASTPGAYTVAASLNNQPAGNSVQAQFGANVAAAVNSIPTLSEWVSIALVLCLGLLGGASGRFQRRPG